MNLAQVLAQQGYAGNDPFPSNVRQPQPDELATALADIGVGIPANLAGLPVDLASALIRPFGYNVPPEQTVGSTEWFQSRAGRDPNSSSSIASAFVAPDAMDLVKLAAVMPGIVKATSKADDVTPLTRNGEPIADTARSSQKSDTSYRGLHSAPEPRGQNSLDNLADVFPDDLYSLEGARYYGHGDMTLDGPTVNIIREMKGNPNKTVTIYRAVPYEKSPAEELESLDAAMSQYMKRGNIPDDYKDAFSGGPWYDKAWDRREELRKIVESGEQSSAGTIGINAGDWVTINKRYAKEHGEAHLGGKFKIVSKKVKAKDLHTDGNSIHEWGYNPK